MSIKKKIKSFLFGLAIMAGIGVAMLLVVMSTLAAIGFRW